MLAPCLADELDGGDVLLVAVGSVAGAGAERPRAGGVAYAVSPRRVQPAIADDVQSLFLLLGAVTLIVGGVGIANTTLVGVLERTGEIGLRRALGAGRREIGRHFLTESTLLGVVSGVIGGSSGIVVVVAIAAAKSRVPVLDPWLPIEAASGGAGLGLLARLYSAWRASRMQPANAIRAGGAEGPIRAEDRLRTVASSG